MQVLDDEGSIWQEDEGCRRNVAMILDRLVQVPPYLDSYLGPYLAPI